MWPSRTSLAVWAIVSWALSGYLTIRWHGTDHTSNQLEETTALRSEISELKQLLAEATEKNEHHGQTSETSERQLNALAVERAMSLVPNSRQTPNSAPHIATNFCRKASFDFPSRDSVIPVKIDYQCNGTAYDDFATQLLRYAENATLHSGSWGKTKLPLPDYSSVLFIGNSHTRQIAYAFICQHGDQVVDFQYHDKTFKKYSLSVTFQNNATIFVLNNSPVEISVEWEKRLEMIVSRPLASWDAIVLGQFNGASKLLKNTNFYKQMMNWSRSGDADLQFGKVEPLDIIRLSDSYHGPIIFATNFAVPTGSAHDQIAETIETIKQKHNRTNLKFISSRGHIAALGGHECGTENRLGVGVCVRQWAASHRCMGIAGAHPDLIAFDVQEALFNMLNEHSSTHFKDKFVELERTNERTTLSRNRKEREASQRASLSFCGDCVWDGGISCGQRKRFLMAKYATNELKALTVVMQNPMCNKSNTSQSSQMLNR